MPGSLRGVYQGNRGRDWGSRGRGSRSRRRSRSRERDRSRRSHGRPASPRRKREPDTGNKGAKGSAWPPSTVAISNLYNQREDQVSPRAIGKLIKLYEECVAKSEPAERAVSAYFARVWSEAVVIPLEYPLGSGLRIIVPARGLQCAHLECFDLGIFAEQSLAQPDDEWKCPICLKPMPRDSLYVETRVLGILSNHAVKAVRFNRNENLKPLFHVSDGPSRAEASCSRSYSSSSSSSDSSPDTSAPAPSSAPMAASSAAPVGPASASRSTVVAPAPPPSAPSVHTATTSSLPYPVAVAASVAAPAAPPEPTTPILTPDIANALFTCLAALAPPAAVTPTPATASAASFPAAANEAAPPVSTNPFSQFNVVDSAKTPSSTRALLDPRLSKQPLPPALQIKTEDKAPAAQKPTQGTVASPPKGGMSPSAAESFLNDFLADEISIVPAPQMQAALKADTSPAFVPTASPDASTPKSPAGTMSDASLAKQLRRAREKVEYRGAALQRVRQERNAARTRVQELEEERARTQVQLELLRAALAEASSATLFEVAESKEAVDQARREAKQARESAATHVRVRAAAEEELVTSLRAQLAAAERDKEQLRKECESLSARLPPSRGPPPRVLPDRTARPALSSPVKSLGALRSPKTVRVSDATPVTGKRSLSPSPAGEPPRKRARMEASGSAGEDASVVERDSAADRWRKCGHTGCPWQSAAPHGETEAVEHERSKEIHSFHMNTQSNCKLCRRLNSEHGWR